MEPVNKGKWDESASLKYKHKFNKKWIRECYRILKDNGTIWISGTLHNIYSIGMALEEEGFKIINNKPGRKQIHHQIQLVKHYTFNRNNTMGKKRYKKGIKIWKRIFIIFLKE